jgi:SAM-dependent methyltransferase
MNRNHERLCPSPAWAQYMHEVVLPLAVRGEDLGSEMLEIGPGPGAATDWLRLHVNRLTAVEVDPVLARRLADRLEGTNVNVSRGDGASLEYSDRSFDSVGAFTMLHHVATLKEQRAIIAEAHRVLRPGGVLVGSDSLPSSGLHAFHAKDTYNPIEPVVLLALLQGIGFERITLVVDEVLTFAAHKSRQGSRRRDAKRTGSRAHTPPGGLEDRCEASL